MDQVVLVPNHATPFAGGGSGGTGNPGSTCPSVMDMVAMDARTQVVAVVLDQVDVQKDTMVVDGLVSSLVAYPS